MDRGQKTRGHTNGGKGMGIMLAKRQGGISCRGYRGLGKMDRGQENGGNGNGEEGNGSRGQKRASKRRQLT